ncbi:hypothetical protein OS493_031462 [Desmophyllum pertusum]|uniref:SRCR domain-containing protein n=1 Tax=Desmophyllum pertusum TaxID=174260 RepID=A0A9X0D7C7_9CNID|nr:hypothetical protein OS493_031462 [Desmophyllum pertusum]
MILGVLMLKLKAQEHARLVERKSVGEGLVQVYYNNTWGWVCADQWDRHDADVVCRMMGFNGSSFVSWGSAVIEQQNDQIWMNNVRCTGNEDSIFSCAHDGLDSINCVNKRKAYVRCNDSKGVRLVGGGTIVSQGRIEVFHDGVWGTVSRYYSRYKELAKVVCRQLGYGGGMLVPSSATLGPGKGVIWMSRLRCNGDEKTITACGHVGWGITDGNHHYDASVICTPTVRLVEGQTGMEGLVQVYYNNTWGWVGADRWDKQDGDVVCRMLGIGGSTSLLHASNSGNYAILMNNVQCTGQESSLFSCLHDVWGSHLGANNHKAGVVCKGQGVRLVDSGPIKSQGRIEVFHKGIWGQVCRSNSRSQQLSQVVCRQLGYEGAEQGPYGTPFGAGVMAWMNNVRCTGNETLLQECKHNIAFQTGYSRSYVASAICTPSVRLVKGRSVKEGFVQVYYNDTWGWICDKQWDKNDADVVCRMLGYEESSSAVHRNEYCGQEEYITWLSNVQCSGNESSLFSCAHDGWENHHCSGRCAIIRKAGVVCKDPKG